MNTATQLLTKTGQAIALQGVRVDARLTDLISEVTVQQTYINQESVNIEAVYTFPLPYNAVLMQLVVDINERRLQGVVVEKKQAEERYESAMVEGDTAIMLQQNEPGLYSMNVGNILPGEKIRISFTYCMLHEWQDDSLRFHLPTVIAPRYGSSGLQPHLEPLADLQVEHAYGLTLSITGLLQHAAISSPTHKVVIQAEQGKTVVTLQGGQAQLDRDFILNMQTSAAEKIAAHWTQDDDGYVAFACFHPRLPQQQPAPRCLKIVVDCSGSMAGDSIYQAKQALKRIVENLRPQDYFNIIAFGNDHRSLSADMLQAQEQNRWLALQQIEQLDANMGGTEISAAMQAAYAMRSPAEVTSDILLITDGEVWQTESILINAKQSKHRVFTVGVGSAVAEAFVRQIAEQTGGACELVTPNENMAEHIYRHVKRIYCSRAIKADIRWPAAATYASPTAGIYDGDTVFAFARFATPPQGPVTLELSMEQGEKIEQTVATSRLDMTLLPRLAAHDAMRYAGREDRLQLALRYQLICELTNYLVIEERAEKAQSLPQLRQVPQMLAAGWGGSGKVGETKMATVAQAPRYKRDLVRRGKMDMSISEESSVTRSIAPLSPAPEKAAAPFDTALRLALGKQAKIQSLADLLALGISMQWMKALTDIMAAGYTEQDVVLHFLHCYAKRYSDRLERAETRWIAKMCKAITIRQSLSNLIDAFI